MTRLVFNWKFVAILAIVFLAHVWFAVTATKAHAVSFAPPASAGSGGLEYSWAAPQIVSTKGTNFTVGGVIKNSTDKMRFVSLIVWAGGSGLQAVSPTLKVQPLYPGGVLEEAQILFPADGGFVYFWEGLIQPSQSVMFTLPVIAGSHPGTYRISEATFVAGQDPVTINVDVELREGPLSQITGN